MTKREKLILFFLWPWKVYRLKRRAIAQRGTIISQRREITRLLAENIALKRQMQRGDIVAARAERNKLRGLAAVHRTIDSLHEENDKLAAEVQRLMLEAN
jgi:hypothetical protein